MNAGGRALLAGTVLLMTGCASGESKVEMRARADPLTKAIRQGHPMIAEARGLLALGNVGLALEAFRKVLREQPDDLDALAGLAGCYERIGRFDLARSKFEAALAVAPRNALLLNAYAALLERQGLVTEAKVLTAEAVAAQITAVAMITNPALSPTQGDRLAAAVEMSGVRSTQAALVFPRPIHSDQPREHRMVNSPTARIAAPRAENAGRPRLVRLSHGEVALVTTGRPAWQTNLAQGDRQSVMVRFAPLKTGVANASIKLLNAARQEGLAAHTRHNLEQSGWIGIAIGNSREIRARSVVLYPANSQVLGRRLAARLGVGSAISSRSESVVVLLGRDLVRPRLAKVRA